MKPKVIDLFAGVGGLSLGFENSGFDVILANEYDPSIAAAYEENHKGTKMISGDITSLDLQKTFSDYAGKVDVIIGGPPCQGFSQKGQRKTIHDERNFLFKYYVKVVELVQPSYFVMENVPNLLTAEGGCFRKEIENGSPKCIGLWCAAKQTEGSYNRETWWRSSRLAFAKKHQCYDLGCYK